MVPSKVMSMRLLQPEKARLPIEVTERGMETVSGRTVLIIGDTGS